MKERSLAARWRLPIALTLTLALSLAWVWPGGALAQGRAEDGPLTQADLDAYIYLLPRLVDAEESAGEHGAQLLRESGLSRRRAAYVTAKLAIAQALVSGLLSSSQLTSDNVPLRLQPSAEELALVNSNLASLVKAQEEARRAAAQRPETKSSP